MEYYGHLAHKFGNLLIDEPRAFEGNITQNFQNLHIDEPRAFVGNIALNFQNLHIDKPRAVEAHNFQNPQTKERRGIDRHLAQKYSAHDHSMMMHKYDLLVHACSCLQSPSCCPYPKCAVAKGMFGHGAMCERRANGGGCHLCYWRESYLQVHIRACKDSNCTILRCRELKEGKAAR